MTSNIFVPYIIGPIGVVELTEDSWVIPRLVQRIAELEEHLQTSLDPVKVDEAGILEKIAAAACRGMDAGIAFISGEDQRELQLTHEATSRAVALTAQKLTELKEHRASLEDQVRAAKEETATVRCEAAAAQDASSKALEDLELTRRAEARAAEDMLMKERTEHRAEIEVLQATITTWQDKCAVTEAAAALAATEMNGIRASRSVANHDLHAARAHLAEVQQQAEDFQRRFLAERLERRRLQEELDDAVRKQNTTSITSTPRIEEIAEVENAPLLLCSKPSEKGVGTAPLPVPVVMRNTAAPFKLRN